MQWNFFCRLLPLVLAMSATAWADSPADAPADAYEACMERIGEKVKSLDYGVFDLRKFHKGVSDDALECNKFIPREERGEYDYRIKSMTLLTQPEDKSGAVSGPFTATTGLVVQSKTGANLHLGGSANLQFPQAGKFSLTEGYDLKLDGDFYVGTTGMPKARVSLEGSHALDVYLNKEQKDELKQIIVGTRPDASEDEPTILDEPYLEDVEEVRFKNFVHLTFDRDLALNRPWDISGGYGYQAEAGGISRGVMLRALLEAGIGGTGDLVAIPYARANVGGKGYYCPFKSKSGNHLFCVSAAVSAQLGLAQAGGDLEFGANYRAKLNNSGKRAKFLNHIDVGSSVNLSGRLDPGGAHGAATWNAIGIKVQ